MTTFPHSSGQGRARSGLRSPDDLGGLLDRLPIGLFRSTADGKILWANRTLADLVGLHDPAALVALSAADLCAELAERAAIRSLVEAGEPILGREVRLRTLTAARTWAGLTLHPVLDADGTVSFYDGMVEEVTAHRPDRERAAGEQEAAETGAGCAVFDADLTLVRVDDRFSEIVGRPPSQLVGTSLADLDATGRLGGSRSRLRQLRSGRLATFELETALRHPARGTVRVRAGISPVVSVDGSVTDFQGEFVDVTDRHPDAIADAASDALMDLAFETSPIGMVVWVGTRISRVNAAFCRMLGLTREEALELTVADVMHPDDLPASEERTADMQSGTLPSYRAERRLQHRDGHYVWVLLSVCALRGPDGEIVGFLNQVIDIAERRRIEEQLRESEERFRSAFDDAPVGMLVVTPEGGVVSVNSALGRMLGHRKTELIGLSISELFGEEAGASPAGQAGVTERSLSHRDGHSIPVLTSVSEVRHAGEGSDTVLVQVVDITDLHQARQDLERSQAENLALLDSIPDLLFRMDREGTILAYRAGLSLGPALPPEAFLGKSIGEIRPQVAEATLELIDDVLDSGSPGMLEYEMEVDGETRSFEARISRIDGEQVLAIIRDITERKRVEEQLQGLVRSKDEFVAAVSHELRTPLTTVVGLASELRDRDAEFTAEETKEFVRLIADQSREMAELVEDLLAAAQADVGLLDVEAMFVDLERQVAEVVAVFPPGKIPIRCDEPVVVLADPFRVRQVVRNLVSNAVRYGGDSIEIEVVSGGDVGVIRVCDNGKGIPEDSWELIFDPYYRAHERQGQPASLGLGLTIGRMLAWLMNGELTYGYENGWSVFELSLPIPGGHHA